MMLKIAHTPDADDAFMFYGMISGSAGIVHVVEDIETLNRKAMRTEYDVTAISAHAYAFVHEKYRILSAGASVGDGYGPVLVCSSERSSAVSAAELEDFESVAIPGRYTTAALLLSLALPDCEVVEMRFERIPNAVLSGDVDAGVLIHEAQITYERLGLKKVLDFWEWWHSRTKLPLPLGLNVINRSISEEKQREFLHEMRESVRYAIEHADEALRYAIKYARGADEDVIRRFVRMYVNERTYMMDEEVVKALDVLYDMGEEHGLFKKPPLDILF